MPLQRYLLILFLGLWSLTAPATERVTYYHHDALGSPVAATDQQGRIVWRKSYAPYGREILNQAPKEVGYTGKLEEADFGINYFGARWYDPAVGRFLAVDPVGFDPRNPQSFNRYAYANNNPYGFVDPDGRAAFAIPIIAVIGLELGNLAFEAYDNVANPCGDCVRSSGVSLPGAGALGRAVAKAADGIGDLTRTAKGTTEVVQRAMSRAELEAVTTSGALSRGGRAGDHFVSDAVNSNANRARQRLALPGSPEVKATLEVPSGVFSGPSKVAPKYNMPGGGTERTAPGNVDVPARVLDVLEY